MSKVHADFVASKRGELKYCALNFEEPICVKTADIKSNLKALAALETTQKLFSLCLLFVVLFGLYFSGRTTFMCP